MPCKPTVGRCDLVEETGGFSGEVASGMRGRKPLLPIHSSGYNCAWQTLLVTFSPLLLSLASKGAHRIQGPYNEGSRTQSCQHRELCDGVDVYLVRFGPLAKDIQFSFGPPSFPLWNFVPCTLFYPSLHNW